MFQKFKIKHAIGIFIILLVVVVYYYEEIKKPETIEIPKSRVQVVAKNIPQDTVITEDMIIIEERYTNDLIKVRDDLITSTSEIVGKVTRVPLYKGEYFLKGRLIDQRITVEDGKVQYVIPIRNESRALDIKKGDFIDVWISNVGKDSLPDARVLFERLKVREVKNEAFMRQMGVESDPTNLLVPFFLIVDLEEWQIKRLINIRDESITVTLHGQNTHFNIEKEILESRDNNKENVNTSQEQNSETQEEVEQTEQEEGN